MRKFLVLLLTATLLFSLIACSQEPTTDEKEPPKNESNTNDNKNNNNEGTQYGITVNDIKFKRIEFEDLPSDIQQSIDRQKSKGGYDLFVNDDNGEMTLVVYAGERPTSGYDIEVVKVEDNEGHTNVFVQETIPTKGQIVTEALTYPIDIVKFSGTTDNINISYINSTKQNNPKEDTGILDGIQKKGIYIGQIDSTSVEMKVDGETNAYRLSEEAKNYLAENPIKSNTKVNILYTINSNDQPIIHKIIK